MKLTLRNRLESNIWKAYLHEILGGMFFAIPVIVLFWQANGLDLNQVMILQAVFSVMVVVFEVPTGYLADLYGRKIALVLAAIFFTIGIITYSMATNFYQFLIGETFFALSSTLGSGTWSAFVYDTLLDLRQEHRYKKVFGNMLFVGLLSLAVANMLGGIIGKIDLRFTLYASIPFFALLIPITLSLEEPRRHKPVIEKGHIKLLLSTLRSTIWQNRKLRWLMIYAGVIYAFNQASLWLYQPYFALTELDLVYFGLVFAAFQIVAAVASKYAHRLEAWIGQKSSLLLLMILIPTSFLLMSNFVFLFSFSFCFLQQFVRGFSGPIVTDYVNKLTSSHLRATVLSVQSLTGRIIYATILPVIGWMTNVYTLVQTLQIMGITISLVGLLLVLALYRTKIIA